MKERAERYAVAAAVLAGFAILAGVLHVRLRDLADAVRSAASAAPPIAAVPPAGGVATVLPATPPARAPAPAVPTDAELAARDREIRTREHVANALTPQRARYTEVCWKPAEKKGLVGLALRFEIAVVLDAEGREKERHVGFVEGPAEFKDCVKKLKPGPISIPGTGREERVSVDLIVP